MARDRDSIVLEADYWGSMLEELNAVNDVFLATADAFSPAVRAIVDAASSGDLERLGGPSGERVLRMTERTLGAIGNALDKLAAGQTHVDALVRLSHGRAIALRREAFADEAGASAGEEVS